MSAVIHLVRVTPKPNGELDVDIGKLKVKRNSDPIVIVWWLENAGDVVFEEPTAPRAGFSWFNGPPNGVFSTLLRSADGKRLVLDDCNTADNQAPDGWIYVLRAYDTNTKQAFETKTSSRSRKGKPRTVTNPAIINK